MILSYSYFSGTQVQGYYEITFFCINLERLMKTFCFDRYVKTSPDYFSISSTTLPKVTKPDERFFSVKLYTHTSKTKKKIKNAMDSTFI